MKRILFYVGIFTLIFSLSSCKKINSFTIFDIPNNQKVNLPASPFAISTPLSITMEIQPKLDSTLQANNFKTSWVQHIYMKSFQVNLTSPADGDLTFLKDVELFISADGMDRIKIASALNVPDNVGKQLSLTVERTDLLNYLLKNKIKLEIAVSTDKSTLTPTTLDINSVFSLDIKILGI